MQERLKVLRKALHLSQTEFGSKLGVSIGVIRNLEYGLTTPSASQLDLIANVYGVNREWLETGEGEMMRDLSREEKIAAFVGEALADEDDDFKRRLLELIVDLSPEEWNALKLLARRFISQQKNEGD